MRIHPTHAALLFAFAGTLVLGVIPRFAPDTAPELAMVTGFALEFFLGMLAFAFASISGPGVLQRLGLGPSRIPWGTCFVLVVGTLLLSFSLNGGAFQPLSIGSDLRRLYFDGDFNIEIAFDDLLKGQACGWVSKAFDLWKALVQQPAGQRAQHLSVTHVAVHE